MDLHQSVAGVVKTVIGGQHDRIVVPIKNSVEGSVTDSLNALAEAKVSVNRGLVKRMDHALVGNWPRSRGLRATHRRFPDVETTYSALGRT